MWKRNCWIQQKNRCCHHHHCSCWRWNRHLEIGNLNHRRWYQKQGNLTRNFGQKRSWLKRRQSQRCWWFHQETRIIKGRRWSFRLDHRKIRYHPTTQWRQCSCFRWISQDRKLKPNYGFSLTRLNLLPSSIRESLEQTFGLKRTIRIINCWWLTKRNCCRWRIRSPLTRTRRNQSHLNWSQGWSWIKISLDLSLTRHLGKNPRWRRLGP